MSADALDLACRILAYPVGSIIALNGCDDLFIDANYLLRGMFRRKNREIAVEDLKATLQQRIAVLIPAWHEAEVIERMLENTLQTIDYDPNRYDVFIGTYPNDLETQDRVDAVCSRVPNVHKVVVPHEGPTSKADCLNWVYQGILLHEEKSGARYDILVMQDAEDIVHPLAFQLYNFVIPEHDFVQTPVFPLEPSSHRKLVAGTYLDEFTESHLKDMLVREKIGGLVPSAGVGSAFRREAFEEIALAHGSQAFNTSSFTEDYEIGLKFRLANKKVFFACRAIKRTRDEIRNGKKVRVTSDEYIATREYFPDTFRAAVRQRSRWILGIVLQTWAQVGWKGSPAVLYCLWRDRKSILTHIANLGAYIVLAYCLTRQVGEWITGSEWSFSDVFPQFSIIWWLLLFNTVITLWRIAMKFAVVEKIYGSAHAFLSVPRFFVGNVVNFAATASAIRQWVHHKMTGQPLRWLKTEHAFPNIEALVTYRRRLGELLMDRHALGRNTLAGALELQKKTGEKLGEVLSLAGIVSEQKVASALGQQYALPAVTPRAAEIPLSLLARLPEEEANRLDVLPIEQKEDDLAVVAVCAPMTAEQKAQLEVLMGMRVQLAFAAPTALHSAREKAYRRVAFERESRPAARLGDRLIELGMITRDQLDRALEEQATTGELLAELLTRKGWVSSESIETASRGALHEGFRPVTPDEADADALRRLGYGLCALYTIVPLRPHHISGARIAAAYPLHFEVRARIAEALAEDIHVVLAPELDVRVALAVAARRAWPNGIAGGTSGLDGVELAAIRDAHRWDEPTTAAFAVSARAAARSPIDHLASLGGLAPPDAARLRAAAYGVPVAGARAMAGALPDSSHAGGVDWLPQALAERNGINVLEARPSSLVVASERPEPPLARQIAGLYPDRPVAWRVAPGTNVRPS